MVLQVRGNLAILAGLQARQRDSTVTRDVQAVNGCGQEYRMEALSKGFSHENP